MRLSVELTRGPIERTRVEVAIVTFFEDDRPLRGSAGRADWRLCGQLSRLVSEGRIQGRRGEAVLVPTRGGMQAPLICTPEGRDLKQHRRRAGTCSHECDRHLFGGRTVAEEAPVASSRGFR